MSERVNEYFTVNYELRRRMCCALDIYIYGSMFMIYIVSVCSANHLYLFHEKCINKSKF